MQPTPQADVFVGIDAHAEHCTFHAIDRDGTVLVRKNVDTSADPLRAAARELPAHAWVLLESSSMAFFVKESLDDLVDRVIVCETRENRWIAKAQDKSDAKDAERLARLLRMGEFKEVHIPIRPRQEIRDLVHAYQRAVSDSIRAKNRIRAQFRCNGVRIKSSAYADGRREALRQLQRPGLQPVFGAQYAILDAAEQAKDTLDHALRSRLSHTKE